MECRDRLEDYLRENGVPFEVQHHPRTITAQEVAATERVPRKMVAKVVMFIRRRDGGVVAAGSLSSRPGEGGQSAGSGKARLAVQADSLGGLYHRAKRAGAYKGPQPFNLSLLHI